MSILCWVKRPRGERRLRWRRPLYRWRRLKWCREWATVIHYRSCVHCTLLSKWERFCRRAISSAIRQHFWIIMALWARQTHCCSALYSIASFQFLDKGSICNSLEVRPEWKVVTQDRPAGTDGRCSRWCRRHADKGVKAFRELTRDGRN